MNQLVKNRESEVERETETPPTDAGVLAVISKAEIDMQIATAHRFPRSITKFRAEAEALVTLSEDVAQECVYALERDGKTIEGPSSRFAEIVASTWGNCRAGARVVDEGAEFVTAQGAFHDLERNVAIQYEVKRRITGRSGRRYSADMIGVTANAACSIALRNAILKGVPKALWTSMYEAAKRTIIGDYKTLASRRQAALDTFRLMGVSPERVFERLGVAGVDDVTIEHVFKLRTLLTAIREGDTTVEEAFPVASAPSEKSGSAALKAGLAAATGSGTDAPKGPETPEPAPGSAQTPPDERAVAGRGRGTKTPNGERQAGKGRRGGLGTEPGSPEVKARFLGAFAESSDLDFLQVKRDEVDFYVWSEADHAEIDAAYRARIDAVENA